MSGSGSFAGGCLGGLFGILLMGGLCVALCAGTIAVIGKAAKDLPPELREKLESAPPPAVDTLTMAKFRQVQTGMTKAQVVAILGSEAELLSENEFAGIKTQLYQWNGFFLASCHITFQNGKVVQKAQFGLK